jgi:cell wall-associated NlpC family hydrolase
VIDPARGASTTKDDEIAGRGAVSPQAVGPAEEVGDLIHQQKGGFGAPTRRGSSERTKGMKPIFALTTTVSAMTAIALAGCSMSAEPLDQEGEELSSVGSVAQAVNTCVSSPEEYTFTSSSPHVIAKIGSTEVARFTEGAYTVSVRGYANRSFATTDTDGVAVNVTHTIYVRTLSAPFSSSMSDEDKTAWLRAAREANCAGNKDILAITNQYTENAPEVWVSGARLMGDADYVSGCDFHDYLCTSWTPPDGSTRLTDLSCQASGACPDPSVSLNVGSMDCSGFVRMVFGHRNNFEAQLPAYTASIGLSAFRYPLSTSQAPTHLPRSSRNQYRYGPGIKVVPFRVASAPTQAEINALQPGDLVFFNLDDTSAACCEPETPDSDDTCCDDGITHVGIYMGEQEARSGKPTRYRLVNSRNSMHGPTLGNTSFINTSSSSGWSSKFRAARRL